MDNQRCLLVEPNPTQALQLKQILHQLGLAVVNVSTVAEGATQIEQSSYNLGIVNESLPDGNGIELIEYAQDIQYPMKTMMLAENHHHPDHPDQNQRITALEKGASDSLTAPFSYRELELRVKRLLLSEKRLQHATLKFRDLSLTRETGEVRIGNRSIDFRPREVQILTCLLHHCKHIVTRNMLCEYIWPDGDYPDYKTIDVYIRRIRMKLKPCQVQLKTVRGFGFKLE